MTTPRLASSRLVRRSAILLGALAAVAVPASAADAAVYCVANPACPAGGVAKSTPEDALKAADVDAAKDTVRIGPGVFPSSGYTALNPVDIVGAGIGATEVVDNFGQFTSGFYLENGADTIAGLSVRLTNQRQIGIELNPGAKAESVRVIADHSLTLERGFVAEAGSDMHSVVVDLGADNSNEGLDDGGGATLTDSTITSGSGIIPDPNGTIARRVTVRATVPLDVFGGTLNIANALLTPHPDDPHSLSFTGADVENGNGGENALLNGADLTIVGGGAGTGIAVRSNTSVNSGAATANVQGAIVRGVAHSLSRQGKSVTETADIGIDHSAYDASTISAGSGNGALTDKGGNLTNGPDPRFVNPAAGDYRLRFDSPLLDKGPPTQPLSDDDPDLGGRSRVRDSDGNGSAVRDIGAYEYQRLAPTATFALAPATTALGAATGFDAAGSGDPDGDPISLAWGFGDGATGSGAQASHTFAAPGSYQATLTATDSTGLSASATRTASVVPAPPAPATGTSPPPALALSGLSESTVRWLAGARLASATRTRLPLGTTFRFNLNRAARVRFDFTQQRAGRRVARRCVAQTARNVRRPRCRRTVTVGTLSLAAHAGANRMRFQGRISRTRTLRPGRYTAVVSATDAAGSRTTPRSLSFTIVKP